MKIKNLSFETWKENHPPDHDDILYRELYPFHVFERIDFDDQRIGQQQKIEFNRIHYYVIVKNIEKQENYETYKTTFDISTVPLSKTQSWKQRGWNTTFQIAFTVDHNFVTVFTRKEDPSKKIVKEFRNTNFKKISENRSLPLSEFLFRILLIEISRENYPNGHQNKLFPIDLNGVRNIFEHNQFKNNKLDFTPIYSIERKLWICYSFSEEKAHRIAFFVSNQCKKLVVVYCNPTYTKHQRCKYEGTEVLSLYEFADLLSNEVRNKYEGRIRFLQNHLNQQQTINIEELRQEIINPKNEIYKIKKSDLMEALGVMKIIPKDDSDFFHSLAAVNLINAYLNQQRKDMTLNTKEMNLFRNMYSFKSYLSDVLTNRISNNEFSVPVYIDKDLIIVEILGFQFSFHNIPLNDTLKKYSLSASNKEIIWSRKKLQPIAPLLLYYSRAMRQEKSVTNLDNNIA